MASNRKQRDESNNTRPHHLKDAVAMSNTTIAMPDDGKIPPNGIVKEALIAHWKITILHSILPVVIILVGVAIEFFGNSTVILTIGSLAYSDTSVSSVNLNLGSVLIVGGIVSLISIIRNSNINIGNK